MSICCTPITHRIVEQLFLLVAPQNMGRSVEHVLSVHLLTVAASVFTKS